MHFTAPELLNPDCDYDYKCDIFSAGAVIFSIAYGRLPFQTEGLNLSPREFAQRILSHALHFPEFPKRSRDLRDLILYMMQSHSAKRPSAGSILRDRRFMSHLSGFGDTSSFEAASSERDIPSSRLAISPDLSQVPVKSLPVVAPSRAANSTPRTELLKIECAPLAQPASKLSKLPDATKLAFLVALFIYLKLLLCHFSFEDTLFEAHLCILSFVALVGTSMILPFFPIPFILSSVGTAVFFSNNIHGTTRAFCETVLFAWLDLLFVLRHRFFGLESVTLREHRA